MPTLQTDDGVKLYYEETGSGVPIVFVHEFAGDYRTWEPQVRHFSRRYRCITYNARGYPPSEVPADVERYSQQRARDDIRCVLDALGIQRAHVVGNSMGGFASLHFGIAHSDRALSCVVAGCGYGAHPAQYAQFQAQSRALAKTMLEEGMAKVAATYGHGPARLQLQAKDPRAFAEFIRNFSEHSAQGSANTMLGYQARRPSLYDLTAEMARIDGADADRCRRRRRPDARTFAADEAHHSRCGTRRTARQRAHDQSGRAGAVQPSAGGFLPSGRVRPLAPKGGEG